MTTQRITRQDVSNAFQRMASAALVAGLDVTGWTLTYGSGPTSFKVSGRGAPQPLSHGSIGRTARQAHDTLSAMAAAYDTIGNALAVARRADDEARRVRATLAAEVSA